MKLLVTGGEGTMGWALREYLPGAVFLSRHVCDVTNDKQLSEVFNAHKPDVVLHAAALTDHQHPNAGEVIRVNVIGTELVARWCRAFQARMVYLSTHYVYPGVTGNYKETDATRPIGTYAWSKLAGEGWAQTVPDRLIVRGSWYTDKKRRGWLQSAVDDAYCSRLPVAHAAARIARLVRGGAGGIYNIGGARRSFYEIASEDGKTPVPCSRKDLHDLPYEFPKDSSVNSEKFEAFVAGR